MDKLSLCISFHRDAAVLKQQCSSPLTKLWFPYCQKLEQAQKRLAGSLYVSDRINGGCGSLPLLREKYSEACLALAEEPVLNYLGCTNS